jgi:hypothetical protein
VEYKIPEHTREIIMNIAMLSTPAIFMMAGMNIHEASGYIFLVVGLIIFGFEIVKRRTDDK